MATVVLHSRLRPDHEDDYDRDHQRIPDPLAASFARVGIHDWTIWRSGLDLFHLVECDDFVAAMTALEDDPANQAWQAFIGRHVDHFIDDQQYQTMPRPQVWRLTDQNSFDQNSFDQNRNQPS